MQSRFARIVFAIFGVVAAWDTFGSQLTPPGVREKWPTTYDLAAKTTGFFPLWVWVAVGAAILIAFTVEYAHQKRGSNTFYSPTVTQIPPTPAQIRAERSAPLRRARKVGVDLRNERIGNDDQFASWVNCYTLWRQETLASATKLSPVLHDRLETLNETRGIPGGVQIFSREHELRIAIIRRSCGA